MSENIPETPQVPEQWPQYPTQVNFPFQTVVRTIVQAVVGYLFAFLVIWLPGTGDLFHQLTPFVVDALTALLTAGGAAFIAWLMSRPGINDQLTRVGLGARPRRAIVE